MTERLSDEPKTKFRAGRHLAPVTTDAETEPPGNLASAVSVRRQGPNAWLRVTGQVTALTRRHLDDWLDWLITTGAGRITVSLATADQIDEDSLRVLRVAQARLRGGNGELLVTAGRAQVRAALSWTSTNCSVSRRAGGPATKPAGQ